MQAFTAVVLGPTGLIGEQVVQQLLNDPAFSKVRILVRRPAHLSHPKLEVKITNFKDPTQFANHVGQGDCIFCCIGTTNKKVGGDKALYRSIDVDIPADAGRIAKDGGFTNFLLVSSVGANAASQNFYLRVKGEVEKELATREFQQLNIFRPSMLLGNRKEFRFGETVGKVVMRLLSRLFFAGFAKYKAIESLTVAKAMVAAAKSDGKGIIIHEYSEMMKAVRVK